MGYSCTAKAAMVLDTFHGGGEVSNTWTWKGTEYFYEQGRENQDGAITGTIWSMSGRRKGSFRISPDGIVERAPHGMRTCLSERDGLAMYLKLHEPGEAWRKACEWDQVDPSEKFVVFSPDNPYAS